MQSFNSAEEYVPSLIPESSVRGRYLEMSQEYADNCVPDVKTVKISFGDRYVLKWMPIITHSFFTVSPGCTSRRREQVKMQTKPASTEIGHSGYHPFDGWLYLAGIVN